MFRRRSRLDKKMKPNHKPDRSPANNLINPPQARKGQIPSKIGIRIADGTFYPILEVGMKEKKKLVLTTAKDNQDKIRIDLFSSRNNTLKGADFIGSLLIEDIISSQKGEQEIEVTIGIDDDGSLNAIASYTKKGVKRSLSANLKIIGDAKRNEAASHMEQAPSSVSLREELRHASYEQNRELRSKNKLTIEGLTKIYGKKVAVNNVSFSMTLGEVVGLLGPNGAGKTTIFYSIVGFIKPTEGKIYLDGEDISGYPMYKRARAGIAYLPQEPSVFRKLTVEKNIWAILETRRDLTKKEKQNKLDGLLEELGITHIRKQKAYTLSGGERRRTEIARSMAIEPKYLLLDEPFAGIDPIAVNEIKKIVQSLSDKGIGVLITDHNVRDTLEITHRSYIINVGEILVSGTKEKLVGDPLAREIYLGEDFKI